MKKMLAQASALSIQALVAAPVALAAHEGHAGDHGWLWGALQPLLSLDHLMAALVVLSVGAVAFAALGRVVARTDHTAAEHDPPR